MEIILRDNGKDFAFKVTKQEQAVQGAYKVTILQAEVDGGIKANIRIFRPVEGIAPKEPPKFDADLDEVMDMLEELEQDENASFADDFLTSIRKFLTERGYLSDKQKQAIRNIYEKRR